MIRFINVFLFVFVLSVIGCQSGGSDKTTDEEKAVTVADSVEVLTSLISLDSANYQLFSKRSRLYLKKGQVDQAFRDLSYAIDMNPTDPELFILLGDIYFIIGKKDNCLSSYRKAAELDPESETPLLKLAETHLILKEYDQASSYISRTLLLNINNPVAYYLKGIQEVEIGDTVSALLDLKIAGNLDTTYYESFMQIGVLYNAMNDSLAIDYYKLALKAIPDEGRALFLLGVSYQNNNNFEQALETYQKITSLYPSNQFAFFNTGYIYMVEMMDFENAKEAFRRAIAIDPNYVDAVYNLGRIFEETGEYDLAKTQYRQALELETNYPLAIEGLNRLDLRN